jgi:orotidine-5'-phosphate decarboxylase
MNSKEIYDLIKKKRSFLCVGLDSYIYNLPAYLLQYDDIVFEFNKQIIDATLPYAIAYKPNLAFYEAMGLEGMESLYKTVEYIRSKNEPVFIIADAKRGDIGNTSAMYAYAYFEEMGFDAVTVSPYMGYDTVKPFLEYEDKWTILLALTSNESAADFQYFENKNGKRLYEEVLDKAKEWGNKDNIMFVVGATKAEELENIRKIVPDNFLLVPGIGAQGGSLSDVAKYGMNEKCGLIVNASRSIIFASLGSDFAEKAAESAKKIQLEMEDILQKHVL